MPTMAEIIVVHGPPGSGKSIHSERLTRFSFNDRPIFHISAGNRMRAIRTRTVDSRFSAEVNDPNAPALLDHGLVNGIIFEYISDCPVDSIVLVDGYPRFADTIDVFMEAIKEGNHALLGCINLNISLEISMSRLPGRGARRGERIGISKDSVEKRFADHLTYTTEAINALGEITSLINIDAEPAIDIVWESFSNAFRTLASNK